MTANDSTTPNAAPNGSGRRVLSDLELARAARAGSHEARRVFVERMQCVPRMLSTLNSRMGQPLGSHDLEDVVQDALIAIWKGLPSYSGLSSLEAWVFRCCHHEFLARLRRRGRSPPAGDMFDLADHPGPSRFDEVHVALGHLDERGRRVVVLKHFDELTFEEIGARLDVTSNTAKTWYYRALQELERWLTRARKGLEP